jgi:hypothetical protein
MAARVELLRDALADLIRGQWNPSAPDQVLATYRFDVYASTLTGRKVIVFPEAYAGFPATRGEDSVDYGFQVWVVERYTGPGQPPDEWVSERVAFVESLLGWVGDPRAVPLLADYPDAYPQEADVTTVYDVVDLMENKLFISVATLLLREDAESAE